MTNEQLRQNAAAMLAFADGKTIECKTSSHITWTSLNPVCDTASWNFDACQYRPKPEPKVRPWNSPADVPLNCWLRYSTDTHSCQLVTDINSHGILLNLGNHEKPEAVRAEWKTIASFWHYSTDRREWRKCEVTED